MKIYLLTKNTGKLKAAKSVFDKYNIDILLVEKEYPEIQADSSLEIAKYSAIKAAKDLNAPVVREDHSLFINDEFRFPGPYTNYFEKKIPVETLLKILAIIGGNSGEFEVATVCAYPNGSTFDFVFKVPMSFGNENKSTRKGWGGLIHLNNEKRAITEYPEEERLEIWNRGYEEIAKHLVV